MRHALIALAFLTGCVGSGARIASDLGPLQVAYDPDLAVFTPATGAGPDNVPSHIEPFPEFGALVVTRVDGAPLTFADFDAVERAVALYCAGRGLGMGDLRFQNETFVMRDCAIAPTSSPDGPADIE